MKLRKRSNDRLRDGPPGGCSEADERSHDPVCLIGFKANALFEVPYTNTISKMFTYALNFR